MSPRAAWRLESLGFGEVYDYDDGKLDWMAAGLPTEGANAQRPRAADVARKEVPTCGVKERLGEVTNRVREQGWDATVVVNEERVVLGLLRSRNWRRTRISSSRRRCDLVRARFGRSYRRARWPNS